MDIQSLYYFKEVCSDLHITKTANRLFISQQTLSNHIMRLEEYYKTPLLNRKPSLSLTTAGEHVLRFAKKLQFNEQNLLDILSDIENETRGVLNFGASIFRMNASIPYILPAFRQDYPYIDIRFNDNYSANLEPLVENGDLDMAIIIGKQHNEHLVYTPLMNDQTMLCIDDALLYQYFKEKTEDIKAASTNGTDLSFLKDIPVCIQENYLGSTIRKCFESVNVQPKDNLRARYNNLCTAIGFTGIAASFITQMDLAARKDSIPSSINIFPVLYNGKPLYQHIFLVQERHRYLTRYALRFKELLVERFKELAQTEVVTE